MFIIAILPTLDLVTIVTVSPFKKNNKFLVILEYTCM